MDKEDKPRSPLIEALRRFAMEPAPPAEPGLMGTLRSIPGPLTITSRLGAFLANQIHPTRRPPITEPVPGRHLGRVSHIGDGNEAIFRDPETGALVMADSAKHLLQFDSKSGRYDVFERQTRDRPANYWDNPIGDYLKAQMDFFTLPYDAVRNRLNPGDAVRRTVDASIGPWPKIDSPFLPPR